MKDKAEPKGRAWLKREMRPYRLPVILLCGLTVAATLFSLAFSYLIRYVINSAAAGKARAMWIFASACAVTALFRVILQAARTYYTEKCRAKIVVGLRSRLFSRLLRADYMQAEKYHSGDLLNRFTTDVFEVANTSVGILPAVTGMCVQCVGAITALFTLDPLFTAIFTAGGIALAACSALFRKATKKYHKQLTEADGKSRSFIQESTASLMTVKSYGAERRADDKSRRLLSGYYSARMKKNRLSTALGGSFSLLSALSSVFAVVWCSVQIVKSGSSDYGSILSVIMLLSQLQQPFSSFSAVLPACYARAAAAERLCETDDVPLEETSTRSRQERDEEYENAKDIRFNNVSFAYDGRRQTLRGGEARVPLKKITCVTGASGSGKSTLFKLLLRMYKPQSGEILLESADGSAAPITAEQRDLFAYVPQGNFLFSGTIYENLTFFTQTGTADERQINRALEAACATFAYDLPEGLSTPLRERGGGLSEGQLQRLAVARALLSDRPVLLLDEATSALDEETERRLLSNIRAMRDKTCLIVTHRPAALSVADVVLRLENGVLSVVRSDGRNGGAEQ
ncbi:MAG: ABC transporter ATP-binding protein [Candidatus Borkfalkiaceae bacterium]|nr:ABC transporter ATP-binding protein [Clostridia bacterium]MDY6223059.1 ABC transporter ATP-binding protein [Christensenellaceae bacterium]